MKRRLITLLLVVCLVAILVPMAASAAAPDNGWYQYPYSDTWCYYVDGAPVRSQVMLIEGAYYGFDDEGWMYDDGHFYLNGNYYYAREDGTLYTNRWAQDWNGEWYYHGADGKALATDDFCMVNEVWFYFDYDGRMAADEIVWSDIYQSYYAISPDGKSHKAITESGWTNPYGTWFYVEDNSGALSPLRCTMRQLDGHWFAFENSGKMVCDGISEDYIFDPSYDGNYCVVANEKGYMIQDGWYQAADGTWYAAQNWRACRDGAYSIGGKLFYFNDDGSLACNQRVGWYDEATEEWVYGFTNSNGEIIKNGWFQDEEGYWYYVKDYQRLEGGVYMVEGAPYAFDWSGRMVTEIGRNSMGGDYFYVVDQFGHLAANKWIEFEDRWFYYGADGKAANDFLKIGSIWYFFDTDGEWLKDRMVWSDSYQAYYVLSEDGRSHKGITKAGWNDVYGNWYYAIAEGSDIVPLRHTMRQIDGKWYAFDWEYKMVCDGASDDSIYDPFAEEDYFVVANKEGHLIQNGWYQDAEGEWYCAQNYRACRSGIHTIGGQEFYFYYDGTLAVNAGVSWYDADLGDWIYSRTDSDGKIMKNGWYQADGIWYYAKNYEIYEDGVYKIDGSYYAFDRSGELYTDVGTIHVDGSWYYVSGSNGLLAANKWRFDKLEDEWFYYGADAKAANGVQTVNGAVYCFYSDGQMKTNCVSGSSMGVYVFGEDGVGKKVNGWFHSPYEDDKDEWMYADGNYLARDEVLTINGVKFAFDDSGYMVTDDCAYDYENEAYYVFGSDGQAITKAGWHAADGVWYYVQSDGTLATDWQKLDGQWFYLQPGMMRDTMEYFGEEDAWYAFGNNGVATKLTGTGWKYVSRGRVYLENGKPVQEAWRQIGGAWYYFYYNGRPYANGNYEIGGKLYGFDADGKMRSGGWFGNSYYYSDGTAATGMKTINGVKFMFNSSGYLVGTGIYEDNGTAYYVAGGYVKFAVKEGWKQFEGNWYYFEEADGYESGYTFARGDHYINDTLYLFDTNGVLLTNGLHEVYGDWFLTDANGEPKTGWQLYGGKWYYSYDGGRLCNDIEWIDGKDFLFLDHVLQVNATVVYGDTIYTTNANGEVVKETELPNGWTYSATNHNYRYMKDGKPYTGWVGDYYIEGGYMRFNTSVKYEGAYYYLGADGRYVRNGWYQLPYGEWIYARADGRLFYNEWMKSGGNWYYFEGTSMAIYNCWIDGVLNRFDEDGIWLGEVSEKDGDMPTKADGWQKIGGKWYYYHAGDPISGRAYIDGAWYCFGSASFHMYAEEADETSRFMITNGIDNPGEGSDCFYYGADGKRANYTGWKKIDGMWYYFNADHSMAHGLQKIGGKYYYFETIGIFDENDIAKSMNGAPAMMTNEGCVIGGELYLFGDDGSCNGATTSNGWHSAGGIWYYVRGGKAVCDETIQIGGTWYSFDYDGWMMTDSICHIERNGKNGPAYFGKDGALVTKAGWYQLDWGVETRWIYVGADGFVYEDGIYRIGGKDYSFDGVWLVE